MSSMKSVSTMRHVEIPGGTWPTNIRGRAAGKPRKLPSLQKMVKFPYVRCVGNFEETDTFLTVS